MTCSMNSRRAKVKYLSGSRTNGRTGGRIWTNGKAGGIDKERRKGRMDGKQQVKKDDPHALVLKYTHKDNYSYNAVPDVYLFQV